MSEITPLQSVEGDTVQHRVALPPSSSSPIDAIMSSNVPDFSTFTCFPSLPIELRFVVWSFALPSNRIVEFTPKNHDTRTYWLRCIEIPGDKEIVPVENKYTLRSTDTLLLQVSQEARAFALNLYKLNSHPLFEHPVYLSPRSDFVLIHDYTTLKDFCHPAESQPSIRGSMNFLAVQPSVDWFRQMNRNPDIDWFIQMHGGVEIEGGAIHGHFHGLDEVVGLLCSAVKQIGTLRELVILDYLDPVNGQSHTAQLKRMMAKDLLAQQTSSRSSETELEISWWSIPEIFIAQPHMEMGYPRDMNLRNDLEAFLEKRKETS